MQQTIDFERQLVLYTQQTFRDLLDGMARPGKIRQLRPFPLENGELSRAETFLVGIGYTLLDVEVSFCVMPQNAAAKLAAELHFHTHAQQAALDQADYIFTTAAIGPDFFAELKRGELEYPDLGATVIMSVASLNAYQAQPDDSSLCLRLEGPGILSQNNLYVGGLQAEHLRVIAAVNAEFPLGIDLILVCGNQFSCLPRTTTIEMRRAV
jgi:alpha-D-ribose 1-methylphosphonate 5-triphosphate synthase subunit PhnH